MTNDSTPSPPALPDDLLLDLVEGTLRAADVERVRAALKGDPELALRLEAMRADRLKVISLADPGVAPAPVGLVSDALGAAERDQILAPTQGVRTGSSVRRLTPALLAACVGIVAVAGWYASTQLGAPTTPSTNTLAQGDDQNNDDAMGPQLPSGEDDQPELVYRQLPTQEDDIFDLLKESGGPLPGSFRSLADATPEEPDAIEAPGAVGAPFDPFAALAQGDTTSSEPQTDTAPDPFSFANANTNAPEVSIPSAAAEWARAGELRVVLAPEAGDGRSDQLSAALRRRLAIAYDPALSSGWGVTSLPALSIRTTASESMTDGVATVGTSTDTTSVSVRTAEDATDEQLLTSLTEMARTLSSLTGVGVALERAPEGQGVQVGAVALDADTLLWWSRPPAKWAPMRIFELPVVTPE